MLLRVAVGVLLAWSASASADDHHHHDHAGHHAAPGAADHDGHHAPNAGVLHGHHHGASYGASLGVLLANYDAPLFSGDYQGTTAGGWWMGERFGVSAALPAYRLTKNGRTVDGIGDAMLHGHAMLLMRGAFALDAMLMVMLPTGDGQQGLGMGHVMLMPDLIARYTAPRIAVAARVGYGYMVGGAAAHADHGQPMWPLVGPMNASELTGGLEGRLALAPTLAAGAHLLGAIPVGDGTNRLIGGGRIVWIAGRAETSIVVEHGVVGSPFGVRGLVETAVRFD